MAKEDWSRTAVADKARDRKSRLAQALKQNLKRRKAGPAAGTGPAEALPVPEPAAPGAETKKGPEGFAGGQSENCLKA